MYIVELLIQADKYEDKGLDTSSFRTKIRRLSSFSFYVTKNTYGKLYNFGNGNGFGNGWGFGYYCYFFGFVYFHGNVYCAGYWNGDFLCTLLNY